MKIRMGEREIKISGFTGYDRVFSLIFEQKFKDGRRIVANFYPDKVTAKNATQPLKTVVLSVKQRTSGQRRGGEWTVLQPPEIIYASPNSPVQEMRLRTKRLKEFLLADQPAGAHFDLEPRNVGRNGEIRFSIDEKLIILCGFLDFAGQYLPGRVVSEGNVKKAYFWADIWSRDSCARAIIPDGSVMLSQVDGRFDLESGRPAGEIKGEIGETLQYGRYLYATVGDKLYVRLWNVTVVNDSSRNQPCRKLHKRIRGKNCTLAVGSFPEVDSFYSVARELQKRIKLVEFWTSGEAYEMGENPVRARFITFRASDNGKVNGWMHFWSRLDDAGKFRSLLRRKLITRDDLLWLLSDKYLIEGPYRSAMNSLIWGLNL
ncbi:MAG: hypothetical protein KJ732_05985 [Candidatus Margulisbacteria bacterium]|nr:hypothetical protein [Candidatus Margulisiibacteriota bacterium]